MTAPVVLAAWLAVGVGAVVAAHLATTAVVRWSAETTVRSRPHPR